MGRVSMNLVPPSWTWYEVKSLFTKEECSKILQLSEDLKLEESLIHHGEKSPVRQSESYFLPEEDPYTWIYERIGQAFLTVNEKEFNYDLTHTEQIQFTKYKKDMFYDKHIDMGLDTFRKLSVSILLNDDYKGGELALHTGSEPDLLKPQTGTAIFFPSYILHEVLPVTEGERNSLVVWASGGKFK